MEELVQDGLEHLFHSPPVLSEEPGKTTKRSVQEGKSKGLDHGGGMNFSPQLNESDDEGREDLERRS